MPLAVIRPLGRPGAQSSGTTADWQDRELRGAAGLRHSRAFACRFLAHAF